PSTNISTKDFETHLQWLKSHNYQVLNLSDAIDFMKSDSVPRRTAVITIDDGYKSFYKNGLPLLVKYNMPATLFINTETVGAADYMDWSELKSTSNQNIEIGNHTHSHAYFLNQPATERYTNFVNDLEGSQKTIEESLGIKPSVFAYPYGEFDEEMKTIVKATGFKGAAAQNSGVIDNTTDLFQLPRFPMSESYAKMFEEKALMQSLKVISSSPIRAIVQKNNPKPTLNLTISVKGLSTDQMQCFVQGTECNFKIIERTTSEIQLTLQATNSIANRRRTLYTLTAPDSLGNWHWYSHLWINPSVK
ncbi:MAG: polysaccharide deacetylase family protein, partial [Cyclobacteriaceae bacterium]